MFLTIGAMTLLSVFLISANRMILDNKMVAAESEYIISAISIGQTLIDEVKTKEFDEAVVGGGTIESIPELSLTLGPEGAEVIEFPDTSSTHAYLSKTLYDDVDDYNGYFRIVNTKRAEQYKVYAIVDYVKASDPDMIIGARTLCKKISLVIKSPYITQIPSVKLSYAFTY
ncbi:hypothetical protein ACFLTH_02140 [Bacteroidota bacterium]